MVLNILKILVILAILVQTFSCTSVEFNNPNDPANSNRASSSSSDKLSSSLVILLSSSSLVFSSSSIATSSNSVSSNSGTFTDARDGKIYKWVKIDSQVWMAENLNYNDASGSVCYNNNTSYCTTYGRLYKWATTRTICPEGWHLPSDSEWDYLITAVGGSSTAGRHLKAADGWNGSGNGLDTYGFAALPGGDGASGGDFFGVGNLGVWWSDTQYNAYDAYRRSMNLNESVSRSNEYKNSTYSVRCVQDSAP
jgi:uncharacterized protein (TIGR02145 family)